MPNLGGWEIVIIVVVVLLLFGAKKLPDMARSVGQSARIFRGEMKGMKNDKGEETPKTAPPVQPAPPAELPPTPVPPTAQVPTPAPEQNAQPADRREP